MTKINHEGFYGRTPYMAKCVCGHVRSSHRDTEPWTQECRGGKCACQAFSDRWSRQPEEPDEPDDG